jgi:3-oxoacyl-[acyl-carrier protein] reductase
VLVTGSSRGIGRAIARAFATTGDRVVLHAVSASNAVAALEELPGDGHGIVEADLRNAGAVESMIGAAVAITGGIDVLVNNAGVAIEHKIADVSYDEWQEAWATTIAVNLIGTANVTFCAARHMMTRGGGRIIMVSSRGAFRGQPDHPAYGASKAGMNSLAQSLAVALAPSGIYVSVVAPSFVETDMSRPELIGERESVVRTQSPLRRLATAEEVAAAVLYLASPQAEFTTGAILDLNGASYLRN